METIVIRPENEAQLNALQTILEGFKVPYENEPASDATEYLSLLLPIKHGSTLRWMKQKR